MYCLLKVSSGFRNSSILSNFNKPPCSGLTLRFEAYYHLSRERRSLLGINPLQLSTAAPTTSLMRGHGLRCHDAVAAPSRPLHLGYCCRLFRIVFDRDDSGSHFHHYFNHRHSRHPAEQTNHKSKARHGSRDIRIGDGNTRNFAAGLIVEESVLVLILVY
jgi:hypothetical protein